MATSFQMLEHEMRDRLAAKNAEIDRLSAELAFMRGHGIVQDNERLKAELAEAKARIAELETRIVSGMSWGGFNIFGDRKSIDEANRLLHEAGRAEQMVVLIKDERARAARAEAERDRERLMRKLYEDAAGDWQPRAERAEAALVPLLEQINVGLGRAVLADAELDISREAHRMVQSALLSQAAETERAEAERDEAVSHNDEVIALMRENAKLREAQDQLMRYLPDIVKNAMLTMWCHICGDTGYHPLDIEHGKGKFLTFEPRHWAQMAGNMVATNARAALAPSLAERDCGCEDASKCWGGSPGIKCRRPFPSPAGRIVTHEEGARMIQEPEPDDGVIVHEDGSVSPPAGENS